MNHSEKFQKLVTSARELADLISAERSSCQEAASRT
jgi:hypothetical protein